jgi:hypothetical protein
MTEAEWLTVHVAALEEAARRLGPRRLRLFAVAACRGMGPMIDYPPAHAALDAAEVFADTGRSKAALRRTRQAVQAVRDEEREAAGGVINFRIDTPLFAVHGAATENAMGVVVASVLLSHDYAPGGSPEDARRRLYRVYREIAGPAEPVAFDPGWRTSTAVALARGMYDGRDFVPMPVLADALQDAGCEDEAVLGHCRDPQAAHVRGCWVVDLVLGKS